MSEYKEQAPDLIFALDIGTRSVIGVVGRAVKGRFDVLAVEKREHEKRAMLDGQIDDIQQVGGLVREVSGALEEKLGTRLTRVCVAAAGRALRTERGEYAWELPQAQTVGEEQIGRLESGAVAAAEAALQEDGGDAQQQFFLVGYTTAQYRLDRYPMTTLRGHSGRVLEAEVVATFLPSAVIESLYAVVRAAGLRVASMTLEPIAAMNAAIPAELRLLNLALVDIGAGTSDIALCREGSVVGYTMVTLAGDEITEAIMRAFLTDFKMAEQIKQDMLCRERILFTDILGLRQELDADAICAAIQEPLRQIADEISRKILEVNGGPPSAVFLAGGGSKLGGLREQIAQMLGMSPQRVAIAGNNFEKSACSEVCDLNDPEYATPLGIAVSAGLDLISDSYRVALNGTSVKLFRSGLLTLREVLFMNGCTAADLIAGAGQNLNITLDGRRLTFRGGPGAPAILRINGVDVALNAVVRAGDRIDFIPAKRGEPAARTLGELLGEAFDGEVLLNNREADKDRLLRSGDVVLTGAGTPAAEKPRPREEVHPSDPAGPQTPPARQEEPPLEVTLNGAPIRLPAKADLTPYYLMDLLEFSGIDFEHLDAPVELMVNGEACMFRQVLKSGDTVVICPQGRTGERCE